MRSNQFQQPLLFRRNADACYRLNRFGSFGANSGSRVGWPLRRDTTVAPILAQLAARMNSPYGGDIYRINDLVKTVKKWQRATLKYASQGCAAARMRPKGVKAQRGTATLAGWPGAVYGNQNLGETLPSKQQRRKKKEERRKKKEERRKKKEERRKKKDER